MLLVHTWRRCPFTSGQGARSRWLVCAVFFLHEQGRVEGLGVRGLGGLQLELTRPGSRLRVKGAKGYLTYKKTHPPRTLP